MGLVGHPDCIRVREAERDQCRCLVHVLLSLFPFSTRPTSSAPLPSVRDLPSPVKPPWMHAEVSFLGVSKSKLANTINQSIPLRGGGKEPKYSTCPSERQRFFLLIGLRLC